MFFWRPREMASAPGGTLSVTTVPAPVYALSPTVTGATKVVSTLVLTFEPIVVRCLLRPS